MWRRRRMENISWTDHMRNEEVLQIFKEERHVIHAIKGRKEGRKKERKEGRLAGLVASCVGAAF
jgi:hypothetical protein